MTKIGDQQPTFSNWNVSKPAASEGKENKKNIALEAKGIMTMKDQNGIDRTYEVKVGLPKSLVEKLGGASYGAEELKTLISDVIRKNGSTIRTLVEANQAQDRTLPTAFRTYVHIPTASADAKDKMPREGGADSEVDSNAFRAEVTLGAAIAKSFNRAMNKPHKDSKKRKKMASEENRSALVDLATTRGAKRTEHKSAQGKHEIDDAVTPSGEYVSGNHKTSPECTTTSQQSNEDLDLDEYEEGIRN